MVRVRFGFCVACYRCMVVAIILTLTVLFYMDNKKCHIKKLNDFSDEAKRYVYFEKVEQSVVFNATELRNWIRTQNAEEKILNLDLYGPLTSDTLIFVVKVQKYSCNLNYFLASLSELKGIQDAFIIFSHSYIDHNINSLIRSIGFCRVLQLFYPYSVQAYPDKFPGYQKNDCPPHLSVRVAEKLNCTGSKYPDMHGRYRNPVYAEMKHHWWWTANKVFEGLSCTIGHKGLVFFLEHNYLLAKDFIYFAHRMEMVMKTLPQCNFLSLGPMSDANDTKLYSVEFTTWYPKYHSDVLAMDVSTWNSIQSHYDLFCLVDDYSWARSLFYISLNRRDGERFKVLSSGAPRALHITSCSTSPFIAEVINCDVTENIFHTLNLQKRYDEILFPSYIEVYSNIELESDGFIIFDHLENRGGWSDPRDKQLCSNITVNKAKKYILNSNMENLDYNDLQ